MDCDALTRKPGRKFFLRRADITARSDVTDAMGIAAHVVAHRENVTAAAADASKIFDASPRPSRAGRPTLGRAHEQLTDNARVGAVGARPPAHFCASQRGRADAAAAAIAHLFLRDSEGDPAPVADGRELLVRPPGLVFCIALGTWGDVFPLFCTAVRALELVALRTPGPAAGTGFSPPPAERRGLVTPCHLEIFFTTHACWVHTLLPWIRGGSTLGPSPVNLFVADGYQLGAPASGDVRSGESVSSGNSEGKPAVRKRPNRPSGNTEGQSDSVLVEGGEEYREREDKRYEETQEIRRVTERSLKGEEDRERWNAREGDGHRKRARRTTVKCHRLTWREVEQDGGAFSSFSALSAPSQRTAFSLKSHSLHVEVLSAQEAHARVQYLQQSLTDAWRCRGDAAADQLQKPKTALVLRRRVEGVSIPSKSVAVGFRKADHSGSVSRAAPLAAEISVAFDTRASSASFFSSCAAAPSKACIQCYPSVPASRGRGAPCTNLATLASGEPALVSPPAASPLRASSAAVAAHHLPVDARLHEFKTRAPPLPTEAAASTPLTTSPCPAAPETSAASRLLAASLPSDAPSTVSATKVASRCCLWFVSLPSSPLLHSAQGGPSEAATSFPCRAEEIEPLMHLLVGTAQQPKKWRITHGSESRKGAVCDGRKQTWRKPTRSVGCPQQHDSNTDVLLHILSEGKGNRSGRLSGRTSQERSQESGRCTEPSIASPSGSDNIEAACTSTPSSKDDSGAPHEASTPGGVREVMLSSMTDTKFSKRRAECKSRKKSGKMTRSRRIHSRSTGCGVPDGGSDASNAPLSSTFCAYPSSCRVSDSATGNVPNAAGTASSSAAFKQWEKMCKTDEPTTKTRCRTMILTEKRGERRSAKLRIHKWLPSRNDSADEYGADGAGERGFRPGGAEWGDDESKAHLPLACVCVCNPFSAVWLHAAEAVGMARLLLVPSPALALRDPPPGLVEALLTRQPQLHGKRSASSERVQNPERCSILCPPDVGVREGKGRARQKVCVSYEQQPLPQKCSLEGSSLESAKCEKSETLCTQANPSTQQRKVQLHLPKRPFVEGAPLNGRKSRLVLTANAAWKRRICYAPAIGAGSTGIENEVGKDLTPEALVAVARWAVQTSSQPLRLDDLRHWQWRLFLADHDAFRERVLRIGPLLPNFLETGASAAVNDITAAVKDAATAVAGDATAASASGIEGAPRDATAKPTSVAAPTAANDGAAAAAGSNAAAGAPTGGEATVCDGAEKEERGMRTAERTKTSDDNTCLLESFDSSPRATVPLMRIEKGRLHFTSEAAYVSPRAANAVSRTGNRARWALSNNGRWKARDRKMSKMCMGISSRSNVRAACNRWCPITSSRNQSVLRLISCARTPWTSRLHAHVDTQPSTKKGRTSEQLLASRGKGTAHPRAIPVIHLIDVDLFPEAVARLPASAVIARPPQAPWKALETLLRSAATPSEATETLQPLLCAASHEGDTAQGKDTPVTKARKTHKPHECEIPAEPAGNADMLQRQGPQRQESERQQKQRRGHLRTRVACDTCFFATDCITRDSLRRESLPHGYSRNNGERQVLQPAKRAPKKPTNIPALRISFFDDAGRSCVRVFSQDKSRWQATPGGCFIDRGQSTTEQHQCCGKCVTQTCLHPSLANAERGALHLQHEELVSHAELLTVLREAGAAYDVKDTSKEAVDACAAVAGGMSMVGIQPEELQQPKYAGAAAVDHAYTCARVRRLTGVLGDQASAGDRTFEAAGHAEDVNSRDRLDMFHCSEQPRDTWVAAHDAPRWICKKIEKGSTSSASISEAHKPESRSEAAGVLDGTSMRVAEGEATRLTTYEEGCFSKIGGRGHGAFAKANLHAAVNVKRREDRPKQEMRIADSPGWLIYVAFGSMHARELGVLPSVPCLAQALAHVGVRLNKRVLLHVPLTSFDAPASVNQGVAETTASSLPQEGSNLHRLTRFRRSESRKDEAPASSSSWRVLVLHSLIDLPRLLKELTTHGDKGECAAEAVHPHFPEESFVTHPSETTCTPVRAATANSAAAVSNVTTLEGVDSLTHYPVTALAFEKAGTSNPLSLHQREPRAVPVGNVARRGAQQEANSRYVSTKAHGEDQETGLVDAAGETNENFENNAFDAPGKADEDVLEADPISDAIVADLHAAQTAGQCKEEICRERALSRHTAGRKEVLTVCEGDWARAHPQTPYTKDGALPLVSACENVSRKSSAVPQNTWFHPSQTTAATICCTHSGFLQSSAGDAALREGSRGVLRDETAQLGGRDGSASATMEANYCRAVQRASDVISVGRGKRMLSVPGITKGVSRDAIVARGGLRERHAVNDLSKTEGNRDLYCVLTHASAGAATTLAPWVTNSSPAHEGGCWSWKQILKNTDCFRAPSGTAVTSCSAPPVLSSTGAHCVQTRLKQQTDQRLQPTLGNPIRQLSCWRSAGVATTTSASWETPASTVPMSEAGSHCPLSFLTKAQQRMPSKAERQLLSRRPSRHGFGIPWLVFPFFFDQPMIATRLAALDLATVASEPLLDCLEEVSALEKELGEQKVAQRAIEANRLPIREKCSLERPQFHASRANTPPSRTTSPLGRRQEYVHETSSPSQLLGTQTEHQLRRLLKNAESDASSTVFQLHTQQEDGQGCQLRNDPESNESKETDCDINSAFKAVAHRCEKSLRQRDTTVGRESCGLELNFIGRTMQDHESSATSVPAKDSSAANKLLLPSYAYRKGDCAAPQWAGDVYSAKTAETPKQRMREGGELKCQSACLLKSKLTRLQQRLVRLLLEDIRAAVWQKECALPAADSDDEWPTATTATSGHAQAVRRQGTDKSRSVAAAGAEITRHSLSTMNSPQTGTHGTRTLFVSSSESGSEGHATGLDDLTASEEAQQRVVPVGKPAGRVFQEDGAYVAAWAILALLQQQS